MQQRLQQINPLHLKASAFLQMFAVGFSTPSLRRHLFCADKINALPRGRDGTRITASTSWRLQNALFLQRCPPGCSRLLQKRERANPGGFACESGITCGSKPATSAAMSTSHSDELFR
jgi:hypothetical protein